jgi:hypothetical protein
MKLMSKNSTRVSQHINAPRAKVYRALVGRLACSGRHLPLSDRGRIDLPVGDMPNY